MNTPKEYRRRLPHIQPDNAVYFITFRLKDTLPAELIKQFSEQVESDNHSQKAQQEYFEAVEDFLDSETLGPTWLKEKAVAKIVMDSIHFYDKNLFKLICFCVMSNHVHFVGYSFKMPLFQIMKGLKTYTATQANKILERKGSFWQWEYFDRIIRDRNDLHHKIQYTLNNPVKAGLVARWEDWPYSWCDNRFLEN